MVTHKKIAYAFVDIDGTLLDSNEAHAHCYYEAAKQLGCDFTFERVC